MRERLNVIFATRFSGFLFGVLFPIPFILLVIQIKFPYLHWYTFKELIRVYAPAVQLGVIANLIPFFLFQRFDWMKASQGIILSTLLFWGALLLYIYFSKF